MTAGIPSQNLSIFSSLQNDFLLYTDIKSLIWENNAVSHDDFIFNRHSLSCITEKSTSESGVSILLWSTRETRNEKARVNTKNGNSKLGIEVAFGLNHRGILVNRKN